MWRMRGVDRATCLVLLLACAHPAIGQDLSVLAPDSVPLLSIGQRGGPEYELYQVTSARWTDDGRIAIGNSGSHEIRIFDPDGGFVSAYGGSGQGPGEFRRLESVHLLPDDRFVAWDIALRRASVFSIDEGFQHTIRLDPGLRGPRLAGTTVDGQLVMTDFRYEGPGAGELGSIFEHRFLYGLDGMRIDSLGAIPGPEGEMTARGQGMEMRPSLFDFSSTYALTDGFLWIQSGRIPGVDVQSLSDSFRREVRWRDGRRPVAEDHVAATVAARVADISDPEQRSLMRKDIAGRPVPDSLPETTAVIADRTENVAWVADFVVPGRGVARRWHVVDPEHGVIGEVDLPEGMDLKDVRGHEILVVERDAFDVEYVRVYRVVEVER